MKFLRSVLKGSGLWLACGILAVGAPEAWAHALWTSPAPRDNRDGWKEDARGFVQPCGVARRAGQPVTRLAAGVPITVKWGETVDHPGCFLVDLSTDDKQFEMLANVKHKKTPPASDANPRPYETTITLPAGMSCENCTLRLRQIMLGSDTMPCPPAAGPSGPSLYYSCANVVIAGAESDGGISVDAGNVKEAGPAAPDVPAPPADAGLDAASTGGVGGSTGGGGGGGTAAAGGRGGAGGTGMPIPVNAPEPVMRTTSGGCAMSASGTWPWSELGVILLAVALVRRRARRR